MWINLGVLPFWIMLIVIPNSKVTRIFINSIILPTIFSATYIYVAYQVILSDEAILEIFKLYLNLDNLYTLFATESFLLIFWIHFVSINLFLGSWAALDGAKYNMSRLLLSFPLILIYFSGIVGILLYWFIRVFYSKKLRFHD
jgi:hypothetical protein|tara:strand:- start:191 stop:619 length:429 start_codon:yes stop_codon:yes gene_type:complete